MKYRKQIMLRIAILLCLLAGLVASFDTLTIHAKKKSGSGKFMIKESSLLMNRREKKKLHVKGKPKNCEIKWSSSKKKIVTVNKKGVIRGKKYGKATITAKAVRKDGKSKSARIRVRVGKKVKKLAMPVQNLALDVGASSKLSVKVSPAKATNPKLLYSSANQNVATVSRTGMVRAKAKGTTTITASSKDGSGVKTSCKVTVLLPSQSVQLTSDNKGPIEVGSSMILRATVLPANASNRNVCYTSMNASVAKVSKYGVVTGVGAGKTTIRVDAQDGRSFATFDVEVYKVELQNQIQIAHRGYSSQAPENTTVAFELAVKNGFYGVECDVRKTYDGKFVIMHDPDLRRMCGYNLNVSHLDLEQIKRCKIINGSNISKYPDLTIPTLEEYLDILATSAVVHPFIELKEEYSKEELKKIVIEVEKRGLLERTCFISMHQSNLLLLKEMEGVNQAGLQYVYGAEDANKSRPVDDSVIRWCIDHAIDLDARHTLISPSDVSRLQESGRKVNVWTVNTRERAYELVRNYNVDMITTEYFLKS